jgi:hypothetical protein
MSLDPEESFKSFLQKAMKSDQYQANNIELFIIQKMKEEGFTEDHIYSMPMKQLWSLFMDSTSNTATKIVSDMALLIEKNPHIIEKASPILDELTKNLEKMCDEMEADLEKREKKKKE